MLKVSYKEVDIIRRGFYEKDHATSAHLENIGISFLDGYHSVLSMDSLSYVCRSMDQKSILYRGFAYEGAAMGLAIQDVFRAKSRKKMAGFLANEANDHIYMSHVGIGWAYARLPFDIEKHLLNYDPLLRWLILDGYGFHQAYFKTDLYFHQKKLPKLSPFATKVFYQGVGRCAWFIGGGDIEQVARSIGSFAAGYHADLWAGVGLACVYAGQAKATDLLGLLDLSQQHHPCFLQGVAFAAKARLRAKLVTDYTRMAVNTLTGLTVEEAAGLTDAALADIDEGSTPAVKYQTWKNNIAMQMTMKVQL